MKKHLGWDRLLIGPIILAALFAAGAPAAAVETADLGQPESIVMEPATGAYFVSSMNGSPLEKDNNGFISKISHDGLVTILKFIEPKDKPYTLHAPKGLAVAGGALYAVDIDGVKAFDPETGAFIRFYDFAAVSPGFLNDIAVDRSGVLFVSDMSEDRIYKLDPRVDEGAVSIYKANVALGQPNGLLVNRETKGLMVVSWGTGRLMEIDPKGHIKFLRKDLGSLDGLAVDAQGNLYISDYNKGEIYVVAKWGRGALSLFQSGLVTPADIYFDDSRGELLVPLMTQNRVTSFRKPAARPT